MSNLLSWNEIRDRACTFQQEWQNEERENAEAKSFCDGFFNIFGVSRRRVATFETKVKKLDGSTGFIDLLWRGQLLIEFKSKGKNLKRAYAQAKDYFPGICESDLPRYILVSDFDKFILYDLDEKKQHRFFLKDLHKNVHLFGFIAGYTQIVLEDENPANIRAAESMGRLHDHLYAVGYRDHALEVYLVRLLFCLFAEDTGLFNKRQFTTYLEQHTSEDGSDLGDRLSTLFCTMDTAHNDRLTILTDSLSAFPYVNGGLFSEQLAPSAFTSAMRDELLTCCRQDWSAISPSIFGSLFQWIMDPVERRDMGAHYTSEKNILKLINALFLKDLYAEFNSIKKQQDKVLDFHEKITKLTFFDPACGCGNFLVIAYREMRKLELKVLEALISFERDPLTDMRGKVLIDVNQFYGIEINEFPMQIARAALWMTDHQANMKMSFTFGKMFRRLPLAESPTVLHGNALTTAWSDVCPRADYILGNPPFKGGLTLSPAQRQERADVFGKEKVGQLDYVGCWYKLAAKYMLQHPDTECGFVSTNSITQGVQPVLLWKPLLPQGFHINFAHRTFEWTSEARGKAHVHCVIIGFSLKEHVVKELFDYHSPAGKAQHYVVPRINAYLVDGPDVLVEKRSKPVCDGVPEMELGSIPRDGGNLLLTQDEKDELVTVCPEAEKWVKPFMGAREFLHNVPRYCLWLEGCTPAMLKAMPLVAARTNAVKEMRKDSSREATKLLAKDSHLFAERRHTGMPYIAIPSVSSERRDSVPMGYVTDGTVLSNAAFMLPNATLYHFGILNSTMHNAWMRAVGGRLESRYRYSNTVVYNNFVWPEATPAQQDNISKAAQGILDARKLYPDSCLADMYDPLLSPVELTRAHRKLDQAVDKAYGFRASSQLTEATRVANMFKLYVAKLASKRAQPHVLDILVSSFNVWPLGEENSVSVLISALHQILRDHFPNTKRDTARVEGLNAALTAFLNREDVKIPSQERKELEALLLRFPKLDRES